MYVLIMNTLILIACVAASVSGGFFIIGKTRKDVEEKKQILRISMQSLAILIILVIAIAITALVRTITT